MKFSLASLFVCLILLAGGSFAQAASFDCSKAKTYAEKTICGDEELSGMDELLMEAYRKALEATPDPRVPRSMARENLKIRELCRNRECLRDWMKNSIALYEGIAQGDDPLPGRYTTNPEKSPSYDSTAVIRKTRGKEVGDYHIEIAGFFSFDTGSVHTCEYGGECRLYGKKVLICDSGVDDPEASSREKKYDLVLEILDRNRVEVIEHSSGWCGARASMTGTYVRQ